MNEPARRWPGPVNPTGFVHTHSPGSVTERQRSYQPPRQRPQRLGRNRDCDTGRCRVTVVHPGCQAHWLGQCRRESVTAGWPRRPHPGPGPAVEPSCRGSPGPGIVGVAVPSQIKLTQSIPTNPRRCKIVRDSHGVASAAPPRRSL